MSEEQETLTMTPKELEYAFAQAARFGAWMQIAYYNEDLFKKIIGEATGDVGKNWEDFNEEEDGNQEQYKQALIKLCWMFLNDTTECGKYGKIVQHNISRLFVNEDVWNQIEIFNDLCDQASHIRSLKK